MNPRSQVRRRKRDDKPRGEFQLYATTSMGLESVLIKELTALGASNIEPGARGAGFSGDLALVYRANLWLRTAHRVLVKIAEFRARDRKELYDGVRAVPWGTHMTPEMTLAVDAVSGLSQLSHTQFVSRVVKDAVVDQFRDTHGRRPSVDPKTPDLLLHARIIDDVCTLSWDSSGERLHRRGYRTAAGVEAPLKETLAAGVLLLSGYDGTGTLVDPMCGSGTLLVEAAMIAKHQAPGLLGRRFGLERHPTFDALRWNGVRAEARALVRELDGVPIRGSDISENAVRAAATALRGAGVDDVVSLRTCPLQELVPPTLPARLVTNPPYGERLGDMGRLGPLYTGLGDLLKQRCGGMTAHVLTSSKFLAGKIGLRTKRRDPVWNGALECRLLHYELY